MKRGAPLKRTPFRRKEGPTFARESKPMARAEVKTKRCTAPKPRKCKHCREVFQPKWHGQTTHDECREPYALKVAEKLQAKRLRAAEKAARADRARTREALDAMKRKPELIALAQTAFNAYIRERDKDKGCFVCGRPFNQHIPGRALHAGHVRSRGAAGHLRFEEDNCLGECEGCNGPHGAKPHQIKAGAIARIGAQRFEELENDNTPRKWTHEELRAIRSTYRAKLKALKAAEKGTP